MSSWSWRQRRSGVHSGAGSGGVSHDRLGRGAREMISRVADNSITHADLSPFYVGPAEMEALARALSGNQTLCELSLNSKTFNVVGVEAGNALARGLQENSSLRSLRLHNVVMGAAGEAAVFRALAQHPSLTDLDMSRDQIRILRAMSDLSEKRSMLTEEERNILHLVPDTRVTIQFPQDAGSESRPPTDGSSSVRSSRDPWDGIPWVEVLGGDDHGARLPRAGEVVPEDVVGPVGEDVRSTALAQTLSNPCGVLAVLNLDGYRLGPAGCACIAKAIPASRCLASIRLRRNDLGSAGVEALGGALAVHEKLRYLDVSRNEIGDRGCSALAEGLQQNTSLTALDLSYNNVSFRTAAALERVLVSHPSLTSLKLEGDVLGEEGGRAIGMALASDKCRVVVLSLRGAPGPKGCRPNVGHEGGRLVAEALRINTTLRALDLSFNDLGENDCAAMLAIASALQVNTTIEVLRLAGNPCGSFRLANPSLNCPLRHLDLCHCMLESLPPDLVKLPLLQRLLLEGNPLQEPYASLDKRGLSYLTSYLSDLIQGQIDVKLPGKLFVVGNSGAGKTALLNSLRAGKVRSLIMSSVRGTAGGSNPAQTMAGVDVGEWKLGKHWRVISWDFAGRMGWGGGYTYITHELFMASRNTVYIVVCNLQDREFPQNVRYWLSFLRNKLVPFESSRRGSCDAAPPLPLRGSVMLPYSASSSTTAHSINEQYDLLPGISRAIPVVIVGSHADRFSTRAGKFLSKKDGGGTRRTQPLPDLRPLFDELKNEYGPKLRLATFAAVDCTAPNTLRNLRRQIKVELAHLFHRPVEQPPAGQPSRQPPIIPIPRYIQLIREHLPAWRRSLKEKREMQRRLPIMRWKEFRERSIAEVATMDDDKLIRGAWFLHDVGELLFFEDIGASVGAPPLDVRATEKCADTPTTEPRTSRHHGHLIVLDLHWLCKDLLLSFFSEGDVGPSAIPNKRGQVHITEIHSSFPQATDAQSVLWLLERLELCYRLDVDSLAFPSLLPVGKPLGVWQKMSAPHIGRRYSCSEPLPIVAPAFFHRFQVRLCQVFDVHTTTTMWRHGGIFCRDEQQLMVRLTRDGKGVDLVARTVIEGSQKSAFELLSDVEDILHELWKHPTLGSHRPRLRMCIVCPHCLREQDATPEDEEEADAVDGEEILRLAYSGKRSAACAKRSLPYSILDALLGGDVTSSPHKLEMVASQVLLLENDGCGNANAGAGKWRSWQSILAKCLRQLSVSVSRKPPVTHASILTQGSLIADRYVVQERLGSGGFGCVYLVEDRRCHGKRVAVKILSDLAFLDSFIQESKVLSQLDRHENIVHVTEVGTHEGTPYFVMEYLQGESMEQRLVREGTMNARDCLEIAGGVLRALHVLHTHRPEPILHLDIKPANIFLCPPSSNSLLSASGFPEHRVVAKILDFGICRAQGDTVVWLHKNPGSRMYASPEQKHYLRQQLDARSDIFSLGIVLYRALTGSLPPPFSMLTGREAVAQSLVNDGVGKNFSPLVIRIVSSSTAENVKLRYPSAKAMLEDVTGALEELGKVEDVWKTQTSVMLPASGKAANEDSETL